MFDLIIKNGSIYDGKGSEPYQADIGISNECNKKGIPRNYNPS